MSLTALPDFQTPLDAGAFQVYYPYASGDHLWLTPDRLVVAQLPDGRPDFVLQMFRGAGMEPYGALDFRLAPQYPIDAALVLTRGRQADAMVAPLPFASGFLHVQALDSGGGAPTEFGPPIPLAWNGLGTTRVVARIDADAAVLIKDVLAGGALAVRATAEMEITGVSPRLPIQVEFNPSDLLAGLAALAPAGAPVPRHAVEDYFCRDLASLPLRVIGQVTLGQQTDFSAALADRVRMRFGTFVPSLDGSQPAILLAGSADAGSGTFHWDLSEPIAANRPVTFSLNPLEAAQQLAAKQGLDAVVHETTVPPLQTGVLSVDVWANVPPNRVGVLALGVNLHAPPWLPWRPQAVTQAAEFTPPADFANLRVRLSPAEAPNYLYSVFAVIQDAAGVRTIRQPELPHGGSYLLLTTADLPLNFVSMTAGPDLLDLATVHGDLVWQAVNGSVDQPFDLNHDRPSAALALPQDAANATLTIQARDRSSGNTLTIGPRPAADTQLGTHSFREYGPHQVMIDCAFDGGASLLAIDLLPEGRPETADEITVLAFTPGHPTHDWTYLARSPFAPGYRYRAHPASDGQPEPWSEIHSPFEALHLVSSADQGGSS